MLIFDVVLCHKGWCSLMMCDRNHEDSAWSRPRSGSRSSQPMPPGGQHVDDKSRRYNFQYRCGTEHAHHTQIIPRIVDVAMADVMSAG